jgi:hypothetical protein
MKRYITIVLMAMSALCSLYGSATAAIKTDGKVRKATPNVSFSATTLPVVDGVVASAEAKRSGDEWQVFVNVKNTTDKAVTLKVKLVAEPDLKADTYLIPGINYNGNGYGSNLDLPQSYGDSKGFIPFPQGWEYNGEPWIFAYDRGSIPSCTISENKESVFALYASDRDKL